MTKLVTLITVLVLTACSQKMVEVDLKGDIAYSLDSAVWAQKIEQSTSIQKDYIFVEPGDTLYSIAMQHNLLYTDLAEKNNLVWPFNLYVGQKIFLPKAKKHKVKVGETIEIIAKQYNIASKDLIAFNELKPPFSVFPGQVIRLIAKQKNLLKNKNIKSTKIVDRSPGATKKIKIINQKIRFKWPVQGTLIHKFGPKGKGYKHDGINIKADLGNPIFATAPGKVVYANNELNRYGNLIIIDHLNGWYSAYAHLDNIKIKKNVIVKQGQIIGYVGNSGSVTSPQLHFALRRDKKPVDPIRFLPKKIKKNKKY